MSGKVISLGIVVGAVCLALGCGKKSSSSGAVCGNDRWETGEECDASDLAGQDCASLGLDDGVLACDSGCTFDVSGCTGTDECGNGAREYPEDCDATDLAGTSCEDLGFDSGTLACSAACSFDTSGCTVVTNCGDGVQELGEECDGSDFGGVDCADLGLGGGTLGCDASCHYDISGCTVQPVCGNGTIEHPETCDGNDLGGEDCQSLGFDVGTLVCDANCALDTSGCLSSPYCGDGVVDAGEGCDDANMVAGDGCDDVCGVETDFLCTGQPSVCLPCVDADGDQYGQGAGCLGTDCNEADILINEGAVETCNGTDDNCDGAVDELTDVTCYTGPAGTDGVGICQQGVQHCVNGAPGPCLGQIIPIAEACNLLDDDCDGQVDEDNPMVSCGLGACRNTVPSCVNGQIQQCTPLPSTGVEQCNDGIDNDCDGLIDEGCACIHVSPHGSDAPNITGGQADPVLTIARGQFLAQQAGNPPQLCVAAQNGCGWYSYPEDVVMVDGIAVYGGYNSNTWNRGCMHQTNIRAPTSTQGLVFGPGITSTTILDGFEVELALNVGSTVAVITVDGATGAQITNNLILGSFTGQETYGVHIINGATPLLFNNAIQGGHGSARTIGVYSVGSAPTIQKSCRTADQDGSGRCTSGCGPLNWGGLAIMAHRPTWPAPLPALAIAYGVRLENSPGAVVDQNEICGTGAVEAAGIKVVGDAAGVIISRNDIGTWGAPESAGIWLEDCAGAAPWIGDNYQIWADGDHTGTAVVDGIRSLGDCHPLIEANLDIKGGFEGSTDNSTGVHCGLGPGSGVTSLCAIIGNQLIRGSQWGFPVSSIGVKCSGGGCALVRGNAMITGRGGVDVRGVYFDQSTSVMVDKNIIHGGCGTSMSTGILADDAGGRIQNNVIYAGNCSSGSIAGGDYAGLWIRSTSGANELDVHSNYIHGGGSFNLNCDSWGVALDVLPGGAPPAGPRGLFRNNIIDSGGCFVNLAVTEEDPAADPRIFENNILLWSATSMALYRNEVGQDITVASTVNTLTDCMCSGNQDFDPQLPGGPGTFSNLPNTSPAINAGTPNGAPNDDYEGDPRPNGPAPDIGPDES